ncbi:MAG: hypothetical protein FJ279_38730 [Planctomycetes bacterium]|nr:hypothetical protein [Planctomycetota bacterium]
MAWLDMSGARYTQPFDYEHYAGGVAARVYHWTKDPDMLFWARQQVEGAAEVFQRFEELPPDQKGIERCKSQRPGAVYSSYHCKNVKFKADYLPGEGVLYFAFDSTPAIISLPTAIWALKGYPDYQLSKDASE